MVFCCSSHFNQIRNNLNHIPNCVPDSPARTTCCTDKHVENRGFIALCANPGAHRPKFDLQFMHLYFQAYYIKDLFVISSCPFSLVFSAAKYGVYSPFPCNILKCSIGHFVGISWSTEFESLLRQVKFSKTGLWLFLHFTPCAYSNEKFIRPRTSLLYLPKSLGKLTSGYNLQWGLLGNAFSKLPHCSHKLLL